MSHNKTATNNRRAPGGGGRPDLTALPLAPPAKDARLRRNPRAAYHVRSMRRSSASGSTTAETRRSLKRRYPPRRSRPAAAVAWGVIPPAAAAAVGSPKPAAAAPAPPPPRTAAPAVPTPAGATVPAGGPPRKRSATAEWRRYVTARRRLATARRRGVDVKTLSMMSVAAEEGSSSPLSPAPAFAPALPFLLLLPVSSPVGAAGSPIREDLNDLSEETMDGSIIFIK
mmetsp:Transcript_4882/g.13893  ORF Transcript_4882/g.13893 Transcript_4882/m.13893 type:complete len:227 (+) Transcript_4882:1853-2533(+)